MRPLRYLSLLTLPCWAGAALAAPRAVALGAAPCVAQRVDAAALAQALRLELAPLGLDAPAPVEAGAAYRLRLDCAGPADLEAQLTRAEPPAASAVRIPLADVGAAARPRTLALALAEQLRALDASAAPPAATLPAASPAHSARRRRAIGGVTIGLGALSLAGVAIGGGLLGVGQSGPQGGPASLTASGAVLLGIGGAALLGGGVGLVLWLRERRAAQAR